MQRSRCVGWYRIEQRRALAPLEAPLVVVVTGSLIPGWRYNNNLLDVAVITVGAGGVIRCEQVTMGHLLSAIDVLLCSCAFFAEWLLFAEVFGEISQKNDSLACELMLIVVSCSLYNIMMILEHLAG